MYHSFSLLRNFINYRFIKFNSYNYDNKKFFIKLWQIDEHLIIKFYKKEKQNCFHKLEDAFLRYKTVHPYSGWVRCRHSKRCEEVGVKPDSRIQGPPPRWPISTVVRDPLRIVEFARMAPVILIVQFPRFSSKWMDHHALALFSRLSLLQFPFNPLFLTDRKVNLLCLLLSLCVKNYTCYTCYLECCWMKSEWKTGGWLIFKVFWNIVLMPFSFLNLEIYKWKATMDSNYIRILFDLSFLCWFILYCDVAPPFLIYLLSILFFFVDLLLLHDLLSFNIDLNILFGKIFQKDWILKVFNRSHIYITLFKVSYLLPILINQYILKKKNEIKNWKKKYLRFVHNLFLYINDIISSYIL